MDTKTRYRFSEMVVAIIVVGVALVWAERLAWNQISNLRRENQEFVRTLQPGNEELASEFLVHADARLTRLQHFLFVALICLLASGATLLVLTYRRMIAPLRTNLTESRMIIERQEKLASLGVFATGIAHEIRNPLTAIKVRLFTLKQSHRPGTSEHEDIQVIGAEIDRLESIVSEFLQFARPADPEFRLVSLRKILMEVQELLEGEFASKDVRLLTRVESDEMVRVDPNKLKQVLLNLAQNGAEAISGGGTVLLQTRVDRRTLQGRVRPVVILDIKDTGSGMPPEIQKRLFDPFFTTKESGTGLGLPIAARIVEKHGGAIDYTSTPGEGTTFSIILPRVQDHEGELEDSAG